MNWLEWVGATVVGGVVGYALFAGALRGLAWAAGRVARRQPPKR